LTSCLVLFSIDIANASYSDVTGEKMLLLDFASKNPTWLHCNGTPVDAQIVNNALKLTSSGQGHCRMGVDAANRSFYTYLVVRMKSAVGGEQASIRFTNGYTDNNSNATPMVDVLATGSPAVLTTEYQDFYLINHNVASPNWNWDFAVYIDIAGVTLYIDEIFYTNTAPVPIITQEITSSAGDNFCEGTTTTLSVFGLTNTNYTWSQTSNGITTPMTEQGQTVSVLPLIGTTIYSVSDGIDTLTKTITVNRCCGNTVSDFSIAKICNPLTIDGIDNEVEWTMSPWVTIDKNHILDGDHDCSHGPGNVLQNPAGQWRSLYDENNIYFYVRVFDPSPQNGTNDYWKDAVEIYIGSNGVSRQFGFTYMPGYSPDGVNSGYYPHQEPRNNVGRIQTVSGVNGYWDLEVQIPIAVNNLDLNGETVRLEVAVNQSAGSNNCRSAQLFTWEAKNYYNANASELHLVSLSDCFSARASKDTVCNGGTTVLSATLEWVGENDFYIWEESADGTNWTNASFSGGDERYNYVTVTPTYNPTYYRALYNNFPSCPVQIIMQTVNVSASSAKTAYHPNEQMEIVGFTALTGDDVQWGWKKSSDSIITNAVWIPGYGLSNDVTKKTFVKTAQESDEGYYFFVVQKECEASSAPLLITVSLEDDPLYECINASDFYVQKICSTPIIDGLDTEIEWWTTPWVKVNKNHYLNGEHDCIQNSLGRPTSNPGGIWRAMYDDNYLYFFVRVYDSIPYNSSTGNGNSAHYWQDAVEVYIGNERQFGYTYNSNGIPFTYGSGVNKGNAAIVKNADSWDLEIRIPVGAGNNIDLSSDSLLMELAINQSIGTENCRIAQLFTWTAKNHYNDGGSLHTVPLSDCLLTHTSIQSSANTIECNETVVLTADVNSKDTTYYYMWQESVDGGQLWSSAEVYSGDSASNEITVKPLISKQYRAIIGNVATCPVLITVIGDCEEEADTATYTCPDMDPSQPHIYKVCQSPRTEKEWNIASWTSIDRNWANLNGDEDCSVSGGSCRREVLQSPAGQWKAVYDNDSIYFKVQVFDSVPNNTSTSASVHWWQDAVEIYINNQTQYGYTYNANGTPYTYGNGNNKGRATITKEADSWYLYVSIPVAGNNINLSSGSLLMEVAVNQSNANCNCRSAQIFTWVPRNHYIESGYLTPVALLDCMSTRAIIGSTQQELTVNDSISCGEEIMLNAGIMSSNPNHHYRWEESRDGGASWSQASVAGGDNVNNNVTVVPMIDNIQYRAVLGSVVTCPITINIEGGDCDTTSCCNQMTRILVVNYPTCGNNGKLILERTSVECGNNNQPSSCSVVWKDNTDRVLGNSFELNNLSAGRYYAEVTCDNGCSNVKEVILNEMPSDTEGGLLGKYYKSSSDTCNFAETNLLFDRIQTIDFDWEQLPDGTLNNVHAIRWTGFVKPICTGEHIFYKNTNTSGRLYINGELLINENNQNGSIVLQSENTYTIVYELINFIPNNTRVKLEWAMPCDSTRQKIDACFLKPDPLKGLAPTGCPTPDFCPNPPCDTIPCQTPPCPVIPDEKVCPRPNVREVLPTYKEICKDGESITLNAFSDGATYLWTPGNQTTSYINVSVSGTYTVTATNWCGSTTESVTVRMLDAEKVGVENGVMSVCANKPLQLKAFGGEKYQWSPSVAFDNPASETPIVTPTNNTNYHVVITTPGGCVVEKDVTVMTKNAIMLDVETDIQGCAGDTVTLSANGADSYLWFPGDGLDCDVCSSTRYIIINNKQAFELTGYKDGCEVTKTVTVRKTVPTDSISINMTVQDSGNCEIGFEAVAPEGYTEYEWHFSDGYATTTNVNAISRTFSGYGTYSVEVTVKNNPACPTQEETYRKTITLSLEDCQCKPCN